MVADTQEGSRCHQLEVMSGLAVGMSHTHAALGFLHDGFILLFLSTSLGGLHEWDAVVGHYISVRSCARSGPAMAMHFLTGRIQKPSRTHPNMGLHPFSSTPQPLTGPWPSTLSDVFHRRFFCLPYRQPSAWKVMVLTLKNSMGGIDELRARLGGIKCPRETRRRNSRDRHVTHTLKFPFSLVADCLTKMEYMLSAVYFSAMPAACAAARSLHRSRGSARRS